MDAHPTKRCSDSNGLRYFTSSFDNPLKVLPSPTMVNQVYSGTLLPDATGPSPAYDDHELMASSTDVSARTAFNTDVQSMTGIAQYLPLETSEAVFETPWDFGYFDFIKCLDS